MISGGIEVNFLRLSKFLAFFIFYFNEILLDRGSFSK